MEEQQMIRPRAHPRDKCHNGHSCGERALRPQEACVRAALFQSVPLSESLPLPSDPLSPSSFPSYVIMSLRSPGCRRSCHQPTKPATSVSPHTHTPHVVVRAAVRAAVRAVRAAVRAAGRTAMAAAYNEGTLVAREHYDTIGVTDS